MSNVCWAWTMGRMLTAQCWPGWCRPPVCSYRGIYALRSRHNTVHYIRNSPNLSSLVWLRFVGSNSDWFSHLQLCPVEVLLLHYNDVTMTVMASQITSLTIVYSTVYSGVHQRKHQSSASLAFVRGIHRGPVNSPHKGPVMRKTFPFDDVIMRKWLFASSICTVTGRDQHFMKWYAKTLRPVDVCLFNGLSSICSASKHFLNQ